MATTEYGTQYNAAYVANPTSKIQQGDLAGQAQYMYFDWAPSGAITVDSIVKLGKLPKGARVIDAVMHSTDLGTTGDLELGWAASAELDSAGAAVELADEDGLITLVDANAAADCNSMQQQMEAGGANAGFLKHFAAEVDVQIHVDEATTAAGTVKGYVKYIIV